MRYSANISMLFSDGILNKLNRAKQFGFKFIEMWSPAKEDINDLKDWSLANDAKVLMINTSPGSIKKKEWGTLSVPGRENFFRLDFIKTINLAVQLRCPLVNLLVGKNIENWFAHEIDSTLEKNLQWALANLPDGMTLVIEALNRIDFPDSIVWNLELAANVIRKVDSSKLKLLFDVYHAKMMGFNISELLENNIGLIEHIQIADFPGRHQPGTGNINFFQLFNQLNALKYKGLIGLEYMPLGNVDEAFSWRDQYA